jgi:hypothetical protein
MYLFHKIFCFVFLVVFSYRCIVAAVIIIVLANRLTVVVKQM